MVLIRKYDPARDRAAVRACFIELQNHERRFDPGMPKGAAIATDYLKLMFARCRRWKGRVFVAERAGRVVGYVCVWAHVEPDEPDENPAAYAYLSDLVVRPGNRGRGIGRELLSAAETYARDRGAHSLRLGVLAANAAARRLYASAGFSDYAVEMAKPLG